MIIEKNGEIRGKRINHVKKRISNWRSQPWGGGQHKKRPTRKDQALNPERSKEGRGDKKKRSKRGRTWDNTKSRNSFVEGGLGKLKGGPG